MINPQIWTEAFHRASREEIGIAIVTNNGKVAHQHLHRNRPPTGFSDYTIARTPDPNIIFIVKPGVTLEDPEVMRELFYGGKG